MSSRYKIIYERDKGKIFSELILLGEKIENIHKEYAFYKKELEKYAKEMDEAENRLNELLKENERLEHMIKDFPECRIMFNRRFIYYFGLPIDDIIIFHHERNKKRSSSLPYRREITI